MQLKKLYINSFKTFAGKFEFDFKEGITAVVGPNGSGKSNLSDAIRWALGEQSIRLLRGSTMSDVIFSGTSSRKQSGMAEVTIVIDNMDRSIPLDFDEVSVTRRVFRDGESHFLMNNIECRLRDITDMFAGTGLGKETYAAIEQGKVDAIISSQPSDRRGIFDEASGIMRYKNRKREAEKKLADVNERTERAADIVEELSLKSPVLSQQAEAAQKFKETKAELEELEFSLICAEVVECQARLVESQQRLDQRASLRAKAEKEISDQDEIYESLRLKQSELDLSYEACLIRSQAASNNSNKHELSIRDKKAERERNIILLNRAELDEDGIKKSIADIDLAIRSKEDAIGKIRASKGEIAFKLKNSIISLETNNSLLKGLEAASQRFRSEHFELVSKISTMRSKRGSLIERLEQSSSRRDRLAGVKSELEYDHSVLFGKSLEAKSLLESKQVESKSIKDGLADAYAGIEGLKERLAAEEGKLKALESELAGKEATLAALSNLQAEHEGYSPAVKALLAAKERGILPGLVSTIGDALQVPDGLETAIEAALGGQINDIICSTSDDALRAVKHLKDNKLGRATFLPLDIIRPMELQSADTFRSQKGYIGIASELISFEANVSPAIEYLLGNTVVYENLESSLKAQKRGFRARSVTLTGETMTSGGAVTGGTRQYDQSSLLKRKNRVALLAKDIAVIHGLIDCEKAILHEIGEDVAGKELVYSEASKCHAVLESVIANLLSDLIRTETETKSIAERKALIEAELAGLQTDDGKYDEEISLLAEAITIAERVEKEHETSNLSSLKQKEDLEKLIRQLNEQATKLRIGIAREEESQKALENESLALRLAKEANLVELARIEREKVNLKDAISKVEGQIAAEENLATGFREETFKCNSELDKLKVLRDELLSSLSEIETALKAKRRRFTAAQASETEASITKAMLTGEFASLTDRLKKDHGITYEDIAENRRDTIDKAAASERITQLKQYISELGDVNLKANDELEELNSRLEFMSGQIDDLDKARISLSQVIKEAERTARKQFLEMFDQIRMHFQTLFERLFEGGHADIVMVDPEDPLESGIEIICRPPGKKLSQLSLLSGGEKALAAIALVFSFLKARPAPFCILDEIDAALDDANLDRFKELVMEYSKNSQMIIITHRRSTMESAIRVYGVTMEEQGISKSVCIDTSQIQFQEGIV